MRKMPLLLGLIALAAAPALATDLAAEKEKRAGLPYIVWGDDGETIGTGDTIAATTWFGGDGLMFISGEMDGADLELQWGFDSGSVVDIDSDAAPDGLRFNSATSNAMTRFCLPFGTADIKFNSAPGTNSAMKIYLLSTNPDKVCQ